MSVEPDAPDNELIELLRQEADRQRAPGAARERVAARLATAGVAGFAASVAGTGHALAVSSASGVTVTFAGLAKTLFVGMGLGASVVVAAHVASNAVQRPGTGSDFAGNATRALEESRGTSLPATATPRAQPANPAAPPSAAATGPSVTSTAAPLSAIASARRLHPPAAGVLSVNPAPELPGPPSAIGGSVSLKDQQRLLERAQAALRSGDALAALAVVREHQVRFPSTAFEEERAVLSIKALLAVGRRAEARAEARRFQARFATSMFSGAVASALATPESTSDFDTNAPERPQSRESP